MRIAGSGAKPQADSEVTGASRMPVGQVEMRLHCGAQLLASGSNEPGA